MTRWRQSAALTASAQAWDLAARRAEVIRELARQRVVSLEDADTAAARLGVSRRQVYVLVGRWRAGEGSMVVRDTPPRRPAISATV
jgi:putative transposase